MHSSYVCFSKWAPENSRGRVQLRKLLLQVLSYKLPPVLGSRQIRINIGHISDSMLIFIAIIGPHYRRCRSECSWWAQWNSFDACAFKAAFTGWRGTFWTHSKEILLHFLGMLQFIAETCDKSGRIPREELFSCFPRYSLPREHRLTHSTVMDLQLWYVRVTITTRTSLKL